MNRSNERILVTHVGSLPRPDDLIELYAADAPDAQLLPRPLRFFLKGIGAFGGHGSTLLSYLLFEKEFCRELITLGYRDAMKKRDEIAALMGIDATGKRATTPPASAVPHG